MTTASSAKKVGTSTTTTEDFFKNTRITWITLVVSLMITAAATLYMKSSVEEISEKDFADHCSEIQTKITERMDAHARILLSGAAFFEASDTVTRETWRIYTQHQKIDKQLPGIQGIGFSLLIPRKDLPRHVNEIRSQGFPKYTVHPDGDRELYSPVVYLEPFTGRNQRALGYDLLTEPVRRAALEQARDTNDAALTGKILLEQETDKDIQAGTLMFVPVYRRGMPVETVEQRRAAIYGWVSSPYRMNDLMQGILSVRNAELGKRLHFQMFDGEQQSIESILYSSHPTEDEKIFSAAHYSKLIPVDFNGKRWTLRFTQTGGSFFSVAYIQVWLTLVGGIIISLLLFALLRNLQYIAANNLRLEAASRSKSDFLANMSHELRTPLNSVIGFSEVLEDEIFGSINEKQHEYVNNILTSGKHLLSLINDILDLSKVESGKMELDLTEFPLREAVESSFVMLKEKALKDGITLSVNLSPETEVSIVADKRKLKQILFNLISNAVKFTPTGGTVGIHAIRDSGFIQITVADSGMGIKEEDMLKLFQPFTQLAPVYTKEFEGTGLGLALNRQLVELHGGRIWVESHVGTGSRFSFTIPLSQTTITVPLR
jgi:signal transduction histidine kinase